MATRRKKTSASGSSKKRTARKRRAPGTRGEESIEISVSQYRSLILERIRAEIDAKRARYEQIATASVDDLLNSGYWKKAYWKKGYWKKGATENPADRVINPATSLLNPIAKN